MRTFNRLFNQNVIKLCLCLFGINVMNISAFGQVLTSGFNAGKGNLNIAFSYTHEKFEEFYRGQEKVVLPLQDVTIQSYGLYMEYGVSDRFDVIANLPHITTTSENTAMESMSGFQDLSLQVKYALINPGTQPFLATLTAGIIIPSSDYSAVIPNTIGTHAFCKQLSVAGLYKFGKGLFGEVASSFIHKNEDAPNAFVSSAKIGWASSKIYSHAWYGKQVSFNGVDMGDPGSTFQQINVNFDKIGAYISYRLIDQMSVGVSGGMVLGGTNVGKAHFISIGVVGNL